MTKNDPKSFHRWDRLDGFKKREKLKMEITNCNVQNREKIIKITNNMKVVPDTDERAEKL